MSSFTVPPEFASVLGPLKELTELRDSAGNVIGVFTPRDDGDLTQPEGAAARFDLEEAERLWEEQRNLPGRPLAEFWREMGRTMGATE